MFGFADGRGILYASTLGAVVRTAALVALGAAVVQRASCSPLGTHDTRWLGFMVAIMHLPLLCLARFVGAYRCKRASPLSSVAVLEGEISALRTEPGAIQLRVTNVLQRTALPDNTPLFAANPASWGELAPRSWEKVYAWLVDAPLVMHRYAAVNQARHPALPSLEQRAVRLTAVEAADLYEHGFAFSDTCEALRDVVHMMRQEIKVFSKPLTKSYLDNLEADMLAVHENAEIVRSFFDVLRDTSDVTLTTVESIGDRPKKLQWTAEWKDLAKEVEFQSLGLQECTADRLQALAPAQFTRLHAALSRPSGGKYLKLRAASGLERLTIPQRTLWVLAVPKEGVIVRFTWPKAGGASTMPHIDSNLFGVPLMQRGTALAPWLFGKHSPLLLLNFWLPWHYQDEKAESCEICGVLPPTCNPSVEHRDVRRRNLGAADGAWRDVNTSGEVTGAPARPLILCDARSLHRETLVNFSQKSPNDTASEAVTDLHSARFDPGAQVWCTYSGDAELRCYAQDQRHLGSWTSKTAVVFHTTRTLHAASPYPGEEQTGPAFDLLREILRKAQLASCEEASVKACAQWSDSKKLIKEWTATVPPELFSGLESVKQGGEAFPPAVRSSAADLLLALRTLNRMAQPDAQTATHKELAEWLEAVLERNTRRSVDARMVAVDPCRLLHKLWYALFAPLCMGLVHWVLGSVVEEEAPLGWRQILFPVIAWLLSAFSLFPFDNFVAWVLGCITSVMLLVVRLLLCYRVS